MWHDFFHCYLNAKNRHWNTDWFLMYISQVKCLFILCEQHLTHLCRMELTTIINWNSPFLFKGMLGGIFHFYSSFNRKLCKQTVETLIRGRILWRLIWVCTICLCPTKRTPGIYGLKMQLFCYLIRVPDIWEVDCGNYLPSESALGTSDFIWKKN